MDLYKENNCHICKKVFCCKKCREKHELTVHEVLVDCDICIYGKAVLKDLPGHLEKHIINKHWPLHCKYCNQIFRTWNELIKQYKCLKEHNQFFDKRCVFGEEKYESPPTGQQTANASYFLNLATSTPLQGIENNFSKQTDQEIITPVEYLGPNKEQKFDCSALKRKVTFCETSMMDSSKIQIKEEYNSKNFNSVSPASDYSPSSKFYSTAQSLQENVTPEANGNKITVNIKKDFGSIKHSETVQENSLWVSAINTSPAVVDENKLSIDEYFTPVLLKEKKRQINVVAPTIVERELTSDSPKENTPESPRTQLNSGESSVDEENHICTPFPSNTNDNNVILYETTKINENGLWTSVTKCVQNITSAVQELYNVKYDCKTPKRSAREYDSKDGPRIKRYKYTEIKCRPPIRDSYAEAEYSGYHSCSSDYNDYFEIPKTFADKAVQTDE